MLSCFQYDILKTGKVSWDLAILFFEARMNQFLKKGFLFSLKTDRLASIYKPQDSFPWFFLFNE
jgi:hypothetical protein